MRTLRPSELRARVERAIVEAEPSTGAGWHASRHPYPDFPPSRDTADVQHQAVAVGCLGTEILEGRQRRAVGAHAITEVAVRATLAIRTDDAVASYDEALDLEIELIQRVMAVHADPDLEIRMDSVGTRAMVAQDLALIEARFSVRHLYPIG